MLGNRLKKLRLEKKLTQLQVAKQVNISEARYNFFGARRADSGAKRTKC